MGRRTVLLIAAILVAALGTTAVFLYASRAEDAAFAAQSPVQVLVATAGIASGTSGATVSSQGSVELKQLPAAAVPAGALSDLTPVAELATLTSVFPGQVILKQMFGAQRDVSGGLTLPKGKMGVAVRLEDPERVAGFVRPGSEVAIFLTTEEGSGQNPTPSVTGVMLERVPVVAVGPSTVSTSTTTADGTTNTEEIPTAILTLALNQQEAQKVIQGSATGSLYFGLLNKESVVDDAATNTSSPDLLK